MERAGAPVITCITGKVMITKRGSSMTIGQMQKKPLNPAQKSTDNNNPKEEQVMNKIIAIAAVLLLTAGVVYAKEYEVQKKAGEYDVLVRIDRNPPITGDNNVSIAVKDAAGKSVTDAKVKIEYSMPPMPGMPASAYKTDAVLKGDVYKAVMGISMPGSWNIAVKIAREGKTSTMRFIVDAK